MPMQGMPNRNNFRNEEDYERARIEYGNVQRQAEQSARQRIWYMDVMFSSVYIFICVVGLLLGMNEKPCGDFKMWIQVALGLYIFDLVVSMNQLMFLKKKRHENLWLILVSLVMMLVFTGWYIYGNVLYYRNRDICTSRTEDAVNLTQTMWILVLIGYMTFLKCCCITSCCIYCIPILVRFYRQQRNYGWEAAGPQLLNNLRRGKFKPSDFEEGKECIICFVPFEETDNVITLPCDTRHIFHDACIETWLRSNNTCPLCKTPITQEALNQQRQA